MPFPFDRWSMGTANFVKKQGTKKHHNIWDTVVQFGVDCFFATCHTTGDWLVLLHRSSHSVGAERSGAERVRGRTGRNTSWTTLSSVRRRAGARLSSPIAPNLPVRRRRYPRCQKVVLLHLLVRRVGSWPAHLKPAYGHIGTSTTKNGFWEN